VNNFLLSILITTWIFIFVWALSLLSNGHAKKGAAAIFCCLWVLFYFVLESLTWGAK
jgi:hypothetical protein